MKKSIKDKSQRKCNPHVPTLTKGFSTYQQSQKEDMLTFSNFLSNCGLQIQARENKPLLTTFKSYYLS